eukprot:5635932-Amphidinium_carterae.1
MKLNSIPTFGDSGVFPFLTFAGLVESAVQLPGCARVDPVPRVSGAPSRPATPCVLKRGAALGHEQHVTWAATPSKLQENQYSTKNNSNNNYITNIEKMRKKSMT